MGSIRRCDSGMEEEKGEKKRRILKVFFVYAGLFFYFPGSIVWNGAARYDMVFMHLLSFF